MRSQSAVLMLAGALAAGCQQSANRLLVDLSASDGVKPSALLVSIYDAHGPIMWNHRLAVGQFPGTLEIDHLPATTQSLRLVIASDAQPPALAGVDVSFVSGKDAHVAVMLNAATPDADSDGVPDEVDDCPSVANPQQTDSAGDGTGDDCRGSDGGGVSDMGTPDLSPGPDMTTPPDMVVIPSKCNYPTAMSPLCDNFEGSGLAGFWGNTQTNGTLSIDNSRAYRGTHSLHIHDNPFVAAMTSDVRLTQQTTLMGTPPADLWVRAFMYTTSAPVNAAQLITAVEMPSPYLGVGVNMDTGDFATFDSVTNGVYLKSSVALPLNRWFCVVWHAHLATDTTGYQQIFLDGSEITAVHGNEPTVPSSPLSIISLGASFYNPPAAGGAFDLWLDEIQFGTSTIQCSD